MQYLLQIFSVYMHMYSMTILHRYMRLLADVLYYIANVTAAHQPCC